MSVNLRNQVLSISEGVITVKVTFDEDNKHAKHYTFLALDKDGYQEDDYAVVTDNDGSPAVVKVLSVDIACDVDVDSSVVYKWLEGRIDPSLPAEREARIEKLVKIFKQKQRERAREAAKVELRDSLGLDDDCLKLLDFKQTDSKGISLLDEDK